MSIATELADALEDGWLENVDLDRVDVDKLQAELRRLERVNAELVEALGRAYAKFGDFRMNWPGRVSLEGQQLLASMREALAFAEERDSQEVQDDYGTRSAREDGIRASLTSATKEQQK